MRHRNITVAHTIDNILVLDKDISLLNMEKPISKKISVKASATKHLGKPPPWDKSLGLEPAICFYDIEDGYETAK